MGLDLARLIDIRLYQAFDLDEAGRVLGGSDDSGSTQLANRADAIPQACSFLARHLARAGEPG